HAYVFSLVKSVCLAAFAVTPYFGIVAAAAVTLPASMTTRPRCARVTVMRHSSAVRARPDPARPRHSRRRSRHLVITSLKGSRSPGYALARRLPDPTRHAENTRHACGTRVVRDPLCQRGRQGVLHGAAAPGAAVRRRRERIRPRRHVLTRRR